MVPRWSRRALEPMGCDPRGHARATVGDTIHLPWSGYDIGRFATLRSRIAPRIIGSAPAGSGARVLYATESRLTVKYTREDNVVEGYKLHLEDICVEPRLRALCERLDREGRRKLPALNIGNPMGRASPPAILVAIRAAGEFMDPRSRKDGWR